MGRFAAELQCLHLDTPLLPQQNTKKPYGTKNSCVLGQSSTNSGQKIQRDQENQLPLLRNLERKQGSQEQKQFTLHICMPLHTIPPKRWANNLSHPSGLTPGHIPTLTPYEEQACSPRGASKARKLFYVLVFPPSTLHASGVPIKFCLNYLSGL